MKFKFTISKWANFYYFMHNFAQCEWPWPYRPNGPISIWKGKFSGFNEWEKECIKSFQKIYRRHFLKFYIGEAFFEGRTPWTDLGKHIPPKDVRELKNIFSLFEKKFKLIFQDNFWFLTQWEKQLSLKSKHQLTNKKINQILDNLFVLDLSPKKFNIFLLLGRKTKIPMDKYIGGAGGERGRGLNPGNILLEFNILCPFKKSDYITGVIWHEITHHYISTSSFNKLLKKRLKKRQAIRYLEEIIIRSLLPIGIVSIRFLNAPYPEKLTFPKEKIPNINPKQTQEIINLINIYIQQNKKLDIQYIETIINILSKTKEWAALLQAAHN